MIEIKLPNVNIKQVILLVTVSQEKKTRTHWVIMQSAWDQAQTTSSSDRATVSAVSEPAVLDLMFQSNLLHLWATKATAAEAGGRILWKNVRKSVVSALNIWATNSATAEINYVSFKAHREIAGVRPWTGVFKETFLFSFLNVCCFTRSNRILLSCDYLKPLKSWFGMLIISR